jgi:hypothetical protein
MPPTKSRKHPPKIVPTDAPISRELHSAIADSGLTPYALMGLSGVDEMGIRRFMSRERTITLESADKLAVSLGLHVIRKARYKSKPRAVEAESSRESAECRIVERQPGDEAIESTDAARDLTSTLLQGIGLSEPIFD